MICPRAPLSPSLTLRLALGLAVLALGGLSASSAKGGGLFGRGAVGGVKIDSEGLLSHPTTEELKELEAAWKAGLQSIPAELDDPAELRFVSLRRLENEIARHREALQSLPDAVNYLAGLQRVRYILVYPEQGDIVIAGPAEGWTVDSRGNVVGATSRRPVIHLDDLMLGLRSAATSGKTAISCSIDPTDAGVRRAQQLSRQISARPGGPGMSVEQYAQQLEQALGDQVITVTGIPATSHFARVLVAADFRMKRLAMNFERAPVDNLPSYLHLARKSRQRQAQLTPRWWLAPHYEPLRKDPQGLAWEIRGQAVKCLTEQDLIAADGSRAPSGRTQEAAQQWADAFTAQFEELAREDSAFGQLRNAMDLAVLGALIAKESLLKTAGLELPWILGEEMLESFNAPRRVASQSSFVKQRGGWLVSASGGVQMDPWYTADQFEVAQGLAGTRSQAEPADSENWWWNDVE